MSISTRFTQTFNLSYPIIQAPMAGGGDTPDLVAAVSNAGALGFIGAAYLSPDQIAATAAQVRQMTSRPFGVNLSAPLAASEPRSNPEIAIRRIAAYFVELDLPAPSVPKPPANSL